MDPKQKAYENLAGTMIQNMQKRQMEAYYCANKEEAVKKVLELLYEGASIGWGGSMTLSESGVMDALKNGNYNLIDRDVPTNPKEQKEVYAKILLADYFFMSTNAITMDGVLVNIDGRGNRVSFLCYGPENVIVIAGMNKVAPDLESAIARARNFAAPANTVRLNRKTPCTVTGRCADCNSPDCICSQIVVTRRSQIPGRIKVILVGEELGY